MKRTSENLIDLGTLDDIELLEELTESSSEEAYREFVSRYYSYVDEECKLKCLKRKIDEHVGKQIAHDTFERVKRTKSFDRTKLNHHDPRKAVCGWLYRILSRLFYDYHRSCQEPESPLEFYMDEINNRIANLDVIDLHAKKELAEQIFQTLNKKEQAVVLADIDNKRLKKYLPEEVNQSLAEALGVKKDTIRKIRERAIKKINHSIDEING